MLRPLTVKFIYPFISLCGGTGSPYCEPGEKCGCEEWEAERNVRITRNKPITMDHEMKSIPIVPPRREFPWGWFALIVLLACVIVAGIADHQWFEATGQAPI